LIDRKYCKIIGFHVFDIKIHQSSSYYLEEDAFFYIFEMCPIGNAENTKNLSDEELTEETYHGDLQSEEDL
jgi:hypothetical protein